MVVVVVVDVVVAALVLVDAGRQAGVTLSSRRRGQI